MNPSSLLRSALGASLLCALLLSFSHSPAFASPTLTTLHSFDGTDGDEPTASMIQGTDGLLYGTTQSQGDEGYVFKLDLDGSNFDHGFSPMATNGIQITSGVIQATDGYLYGTTSLGGAGFLGSIYRESTDGSSITDLYDFGLTAGDGKEPAGGLIQGSDGAFYGTTALGGVSNDGTIFRYSTGTGLVILHSFGSNDLQTPEASLIQAQDGGLYGTTLNGGTNGLGGVFRVNLDGSGYTVLHDFSGAPTDGAGPNTSLVQGSDGFLYGTAGGGSNNNGVIFKIALDGSGYQVLNNFINTISFGVLPGTLAVGNDDNLYGVTFNGGANENGTIFEMALDGSGYNILHFFSGTDGSGPIGGLLQATNGIFYGTTMEGIGGDLLGTVFSFDTGLPASPTGLSLLVQTPVDIDLKWNAFAGASSYNLYRSTTPGQETLPPGGSGLTSQTYTDVDLEPATTYYYRVTAMVGGVETAMSAEMSATTSMMGFAPGLQMISAPADYPGLTVEKYLSHPELAVWTDSKYAITPNSPADTIVPGQGYWINVPAGTVANLWDNGAILTGTSDVQVPLVAGWNMIGTPFRLDVLTDDVNVQSGSNQPVSFETANLDGVVSNTLYTYQPGDTAYEVIPAPGASLVPYEGYWLYAFKPCTLIFPAGG